jgi:hypothetical protein
MTAQARRGRAVPLGIAALTAAAGLAIAGCGGGGAPVAPPPPAQPAPTAEGDAAVIAWTGSVCSALFPVVQALRTSPRPDLSDAAAAKQAYVAYVDRALQETEQAAQQVDQAGAPPIQNGAEVAQDVRGQLADLRQDLEQARAQLEQADPADPAAVGQAMAAAGNIVSSMGNSAQAVAALSGDPQLSEAFNQAESCDQLRTLGTPS